MSRIAGRFAALKAEGRAGLVTFLTAGDPDRATGQALLDGLPAAGADLIEIGMPFSDPMADGPAIQASSLRALNGGANLVSTLEMVRKFRTKDQLTPIILMGYYNPVHAHGVAPFCVEAAAAGVDGLIIVDLPPEEAEELAGPARDQGIDFIFLTAPTTDDARLPVVLASASGFVYYVSIAGVTGTASASLDTIGGAMARLRRHTSLPIAVGFGLKTAEQVTAVGKLADAAVVGSAIVQKLADGLMPDGKPKPGLVGEVLAFVGELSAGLRLVKA
ncbi:tryptophan synthase subunit alpha [Telmatospirillum siberiense]|uniref:Tryptophan synthase alpha chain n=1 Tax=Telmatospirillum siberiense TaxID=382514 RepID=A0A2N3PSM6_9PROT|nr:tryptophan synthase subunit alpha [Telmatospirillum siberiense]PKU23407.1 tryptophan synthase subunit alpha [Telmatospirillum siberiense]